MSNIFSYSLGVFIIVFIAGCILNLLRNHYIYQLIGIAFFFTFSVIRASWVIYSFPDITARGLYLDVLPALSGVSACLASMLLGYLFFPAVRKRIRI